MALGDVIARLSVQLGMETAAFEKGATIAEKRMAQSQRTFAQIGKKMSGIGKTMALGITAPLAALGVSAAKAAVASRDAIGQMEATLESMGDGAGRSSDQLQKLAKDLEGISEYDDKQILREVTSNMLTFGDIAGDNFDRANKAAVNLSAKLGQDLKSSTILIGKALNDPVKGLSALSRVGVKLAPEQEELAKKMAKAGDVAGAQAIILAELEKQYEGSAKAVRDAAPGSDTINKWSDMQEKIGDLVLVVADKLMPILNRVIDSFLNLSPEMQQFVIVAAAVAAAIGPVLIVVGSMVGAIGKLLPVLSALRTAMLLIAANPVILGLAAVIAGIYLAWKNWEKITAIVQNLYQGVKTWVYDRLGAIWNWLKGKLEAVGGWFFDLYDKVVGHSYIPDMVEEIGQNMNLLQSLMVDPALKATKDTKEAFRNLASDVGAIIDRLFPKIAALRAMKEDLATIEAGRKAGIISEATAEEAARRLRRINMGLDPEGPNLRVSDDLLNTPPLVKGLENLGDATKALADKAKVQTVRIAESFKDMAEKTMQSVRRLADAIKGGGFLDILEAVIGLGLQLGSIGVFGKKIQRNVNKPVPGYASGTNFHPGGLAMVGERGPELVSMPRGSKVFTSKETGDMLGGRQRIDIVPSPYFDVVVDGRVMRAGPTIAQGGAQLAGQQAMFQRSRRLA